MPHLPAVVHDADKLAEVRCNRPLLRVQGARGKRPALVELARDEIKRVRG